jgi:indole-3-glycerol phosphate synthase
MTDRDGGSMSVLDDIVAGVRIDLAERESVTSLPDLRAALADVDPPRDPMPHFRAPGSSVIAEVKRRSPSKGDLADIADPAALAMQYAVGGAAAISVLTEQRRFGGSLDDLRAVRAAVETPLLRKDFVVDRYQLLEARAAGADAALLIVAALSEDGLRRLLDGCGELGLAALVEVHDEADADIALRTGARIVGVNNRNLKSFTVDLRTSERILPLLPAGVKGVSESGVRTVEDAQRLRRAGATNLLVGEALVRAENPGALVRELCA